jgi:DNA repair protein RadC
MKKTTNAVKESGIKNESPAAYVAAAAKQVIPPAYRGLEHQAEDTIVGALLSVSVEDGTARSMILEAGSLRELVRRNDILELAMELSRRVMLETMTSSDCLSSSALTRAYLRSRLRDQRNEIFLALFLDNQNRVIACEELARGTIDGATVHPRIVVTQALHHNAAAVIFAHNHPSGMPEPSQADVGITRRLKNALVLLDIRVLDHFVVGDSEVVSLAERGLV